MDVDIADFDLSASAPVVCETPFGLMLTTVEKMLKKNEKSHGNPTTMPTTSTTLTRINPFVVDLTDSDPIPVSSGEEEKLANLFRRPPHPIIPAPKYPTLEKHDGLSGLQESFLPTSSPRVQRVTVLCPVVSEFISKKHSRTKVFSGVKSVNLKSPKLWMPSGIKTLKELCSSVVQDNAENLIGFHKLNEADLLNVLQNVGVKQLREIEKNNPEISDKTDEIWKIHYYQDFKVSVHLTTKFWRDAYQSAEEDRRKNLKNIAKRARAVEDGRSAKSPKLRLDDKGFMDTFERAFDTKRNAKRSAGIKRSFPNSDNEEQSHKKHL